eukprot:6321274-Amphidinium_carterae.1
MSVLFVALSGRQASLWCLVQKQQAEKNFNFQLQTDYHDPDAIPPRQPYKAAQSQVTAIFTKRSRKGQQR